MIILIKNSIHFPRIFMKVFVVLVLLFEADRLLTGVPSEVTFPYSYRYDELKLPMPLSAFKK